MKRPGFMVIWPFHLDSSRTRGQGRRLPVARALKQPSSKDIWQAAMALGYSPENQEKAALPRFSWEKTGYVVVKRSGERRAVLRAIAGEIVKNRQREAEVPAAKKR